MSWQVRCRGPAGQTILSGVDQSTTLAELQRLVEGATGVPIRKQEILLGFPPRPVDVSDSSALISSVGISNGDSITVRAVEPPASTAAEEPPAVADAERFGNAEDSDDEELALAIAASMADAVQPAPQPNVQPSGSGAGGGLQGEKRFCIPLPDNSGSYVVRRKMADDNSCLFSAIGYVMEHDRHVAQELRKVVAEAVAFDPFTYNDAVLGKDAQEYCKWILQKNSWGGYIELAILSKHYCREIAAYDIVSQRLDVHGGDQGYTERVAVVFDGIHYDAVALAAFEDAPEELDITVWSTGGAEAPLLAEAAKQLVDNLRSARQFTDTANYTLRCDVCQTGLRGDKEASQHALQTGHGAFSQYE